MALQKRDVHGIRTETDIVLIRQAVRRSCIEQGFSLIEQTKLVTAVSEIARNTFKYGGGGEAVIEVHLEGVRKGVRVVFVDQGPGITNIEEAMRDGYTSGDGMGHGLGGAKRLVEQFSIESTPGVGTTVAMTRWK